MTKKIDLFTVILFCTLIFALTAAFSILPDREFSPAENRDLQQAPTIDSGSFFSGKFGQELNVYFADQFPLRDGFVSARAAMELALLKKENNGVLVGDDGYLAVRLFDAYRSRIEKVLDTDYFFESNVQNGIDALNAFSQSTPVPVVTLIPPRTVDAAASKFDYTPPQGDLLYRMLREGLADSTGYIDLLPLMREKLESGEYVYYKTDHHWTTLGAYYAYQKVMEQLGREDKIIPKDNFSVREVPSFFGTTAARLGLNISEDTIELWSAGDEALYTVTVDGVQMNGFFSEKHLSTRDKYAVFLDGTHGLVTVEKNGESRKKLLVVKDSFADCLVPFLAHEFDLVVLNLSSAANVTSFLEYYDCDAVLLVYNAENLITTGTMSNLR